MVDIDISTGVSAFTGGASGERSTYELFVGPTSFVVVSFTGRERISRLFSFDVSVIAPAALDAVRAAMVGAPATLAMHLGSATRVVQGIVASVRVDGGATSPRVAVIRLVPKMWLLKRRATSRVFQDLTVPEVIAKVLDDARIPHTERLSRTYVKRAYCLQYQETDFAFVRRLAAEEGMFFFFEPPLVPLEELLGAIGGAAGAAIGSAVSAIGSTVGAPADLGLFETVVFADDAKGYSSIDPSVSAGIDLGVVSASATLGGAHLRLRAGTSAARTTEDEVTQFTLTESVRSNSALLRDYDFQRPMQQLSAEAYARPSAALSATASPEAALGALANAAAGVLATAFTDELRVYDHHGEYDVPDVAQDRARLHLEQHRTRLNVGSGESGHARLAPGYRFSLTADATPGLDGEYAVIGVHHEGHHPAHTHRTAKSEGGFAQTYANRFECLPATVPARPKRPRRRVKNVIESAVVVGPKSGDDIHTDEYGRIRVQFHWDLYGGRDDKSSCWIRVAQAWAGASFGAQFVPRVGTEVLVSFLGGDPDCPVVTGSVYNATHPVPFKLPDDKTRSGFRTQSSPGGEGANELSFEDAKGHEQVYLRAERDHDELVQHDHTLEVGNDEKTHIGGSQALVVELDRAETVKGVLTRNVTKDEKILIEGNRLDVVKGNIDSRTSGEVSTRIARERREVTGRGDLTVGDDYTVRTKGCYTTIVGKNDAKRSYVLRVEGTGQLSSSGVFEIDAEKGLTLRCGKSFIKVSADKIELVAPAVSARGTGGGIVIDDKDLKINAQGDAVMKVKTLLIKAEESSLSLKKDVQIDGQKILLNSPDEADDPVADKAPPPTGIQMKDKSGKPLAYQRFLIKLTDGSEYSGILDADGKTEMELDGSGTITFPDLSKPS